MSKQRKPDAGHFTAAALAGIKQQRKGTIMPRSNTITERLSVSSGIRRDSSDSYDKQHRQSWLDKVQRRGSVYGKKGKVIEEVRLPENFYGIYSIRYSPDNETIVVSFGAGAIQVRRNDGDLVCTVRGATEHGFPVMCVRFLPNRADTFFSASACGSIFICATKAGEYKKFAEERNNEINSVDINLGSDTLVSGGKDAVIRLYDINSGKLRQSLFKTEQETTNDNAHLFHKMRIFAVKFHPVEKNIFLSGGWDDDVKIWDLRVNDGCIRNIKGPHICGDAIDIRDRTVLTGSWTVDRSLQIWDLSSGRLIDTITPTNRPHSIDGEFLYAVQFFHGDNLADTVLSGGSGTGVVEAISIKEKKVTTSFRIHKTIQAIDSNEQFVVFGGMETLLRIATVQVQ